MTRPPVLAAATVRRIRGLLHAAQSPAAIAEAALIDDPELIVRLAHLPLSPHRRVPDDVAFSIWQATVQLRDAGATCLAAREHAITSEWAPLWAWDDEVIRIDDATIPDALAARLARCELLERRAALRQLRVDAQARAARAEKRRAVLAVNRQLRRRPKAA